MFPNTKHKNGLMHLECGPFMSKAGGFSNASEAVR